jgi:hypothetical protein
MTHHGGNHMRKKIVGIFVIMLLITTLVIPISAMNKDDLLKNTSISRDADVPTWKVGDSWTYNTHIYHASAENLSVNMILDVTGELIFEVVDDTGDFYTIEGLMKPMHGIVDLPGTIDMRITRFSSYKSILEIQKSNLSIISYDETRKGIVLLTIGSIPLPIPIQIQNKLKTEFKPMWEILPFPLFDGKMGNYENCSMIKEWVTSMFWGFIILDSGNSSQGWVGGSYECNEETITVEAGTFDVYNVSCITNYGPDVQERYISNYAEEVGNIVEGLYDLPFLNGDRGFLIELELRSTTYEP